MKKRLASVLLVLSCLLSLPVPAWAAEVQSVQLSQTLEEIVVEGVRVGFLDSRKKERQAITCHGSIYIPLTTAGLWMGADTAWDESTARVTITSNGAEPVCYGEGDLDRMGAEPPEGYECELEGNGEAWLLTNGVVLVNGREKLLVNALGEKVSPILFEDEVYLPVRSVGELLGKEVLWVSGKPNGSLGSVHLYDAPAPEALEQAKAYYAAAQGCLEDIRTLLEETYVVGTDEGYIEHMRKIQEFLLTLLELPVPPVPCLTQYVEGLRSGAELVLFDKVDQYMPLEYQSGYAGREPKTIPAFAYFWRRSPDKRWKDIKSIFLPMYADATSYFMELERTCGRGKEFLEAVSALAVQEKAAS